MLNLNDFKNYPEEIPGRDGNHLVIIEKNYPDMSLTKYEINFFHNGSWNYSLMDSFSKIVKFYELPQTDSDDKRIIKPISERFAEAWFTELADEAKDLGEKYLINHVTIFTIVYKWLSNQK